MPLGNLSYGTREGLAVRLDWDRAMQADRYANALKQQAQLQAQQKAKMFANDWSYNNAMNSHDNPLVKDFARGKLQEIGSFISQNRDFETNPFKMAKYNEMIRELKDNPDLNRGMLSDASYKKMMEFAANGKNKAMVNSPWWQDRMSEWNNYLKYGNQYGEEAAKKGKQAFMFQAPEELIDVQAHALDIGKKLGTTTRLVKGPGFGASETFVDPQKIKDEAINFFRGPKAFSFNWAWDNLSDDEKTYYGNDRIKWAEALIKPGTDYKKTAGQYIKPDSGDGDGTKFGGYSAYDHQVRRSPAWQVNNSPDMKYLSPLQNEDGRGNGFLNTNQPLRIRIKNKDGSISWKLVSGMENTDIPAYRTNDYMVDGNGQVMMRMKADINLDSDNSSQVRNMFDESRWYQLFGDDFSEQDAYKSVARLKEDEKGNKTNIAQLDVWVPANTSYANIKNYDNAQLGVSASNQAYPNVVGSVESENYIRQKDEAGNVWITDRQGNVIRREK